MLFPLFLGDVAEFDYRQLAPCQFKPIRRPDRNRRRTSVLAEYVQTRVGRCRGLCLLNFRLDLPALALRMQQGHVHPISSSREYPISACAAGFASTQAGRHVNRKFAVLCVTPAQGIQAFSILRGGCVVIPWALVRSTAGSNQAQWKPQLFAIEIISIPPEPQVKRKT